jgi:hypothetical protein
MTGFKPFVLSVGPKARSQTITRRECPSTSAPRTYAQDEWIDSAARVDT